MNNAQRLRSPSYTTHRPASHRGATCPTDSSTYRESVCRHAVYRMLSRATVYLELSPRETHDGGAVRRGLLDRRRVDVASARRVDALNELALVRRRALQELRLCALSKKRCHLAVCAISPRSNRSFASMSFKKTAVCILFPAAAGFSVILLGNADEKKPACPPSLDRRPYRGWR